jgi:O-antigen ligase
LLLIIVTLPFTILTNSFLVILLSLNWILAGKFKHKFRSLSGNKLALGFVCFYILHLIGLLYTTDLKSGLADIQTKLSILVFPLILVSSTPLTRKQYTTILAGFVLSCTLALIVCFSYALYQFYLNQTVQYFYYHDLSSILGIHAVYLAMYVNLAIGIVVYFLNKYWKQLGRGGIFAMFLLIALLFTGIVFLSSKTIIIVVFIFANLFLIKLFYKRQGVVLSLAYALLINICFIILLYNIPYTRARFEDSIHSDFESIRKKDYNIVHSGLSVRLSMWKFCVEILNEEGAWLTGVGTGDGQLFLDNSYKKYDMYTGNIYLNDKGFLGFNAHNQYFQFLLSLGVLSVVYFMALLYMSGMLFLRQQNYLALFFLLSFAIAAITESNLCAQKGTVFFGFFMALFAFQSPVSAKQPLQPAKLPNS